MNKDSHIVFFLDLPAFFLGCFLIRGAHFWSLPFLLLSPCRVYVLFYFHEKCICCPQFSFVSWDKYSDKVDFLNLFSCVLYSFFFFFCLSISKVCLQCFCPFFKKISLFFSDRYNSLTESGFFLLTLLLDFILHCYPSFGTRHKKWPGPFFPDLQLPGKSKGGAE